MVEESVSTSAEPSVTAILARTCEGVSVDQPVVCNRDSSRGSCLWCGGPMPLGRRRGSVRKFCRREHRIAFQTAARRFVNQAIADGLLSVGDLRASPKARALQSGAISGGSATRVAKTAPSAQRAKIRVLWASPTLARASHAKQAAA